MVVQRSISRKRYLIAAVITILIFFLGLLLGIIYDTARLSKISKENKIQEMDYKSLQLQYLMLSNLQRNANVCSLLTATLDDSIRNLHNSLEKLNDYKEDAQLNSEDFNLLQRRYVLDNIQYWQFAKRTKIECGMDLVNILYFFSTKNCNVCPNQGVILTYFKKKFGDKVLIFPLDIDLENDERMLSLLRNSHNITSYPSLVIGDDIYQGSVVESEALQKMICNRYVVKPEECFEDVKKNETA